MRENIGDTFFRAQHCRRTGAWSAPLAHHATALAPAGLAPRVHCVCILSRARTRMYVRSMADIADIEGTAFGEWGATWKIWSSLARRGTGSRNAILFCERVRTVVLARGPLHLRIINARRAYHAIRCLPANPRAPAGQTPGSRSVMSARSLALLSFCSIRFPNVAIRCSLFVQALATVPLRGGRPVLAPERHTCRSGSTPTTAIQDAGSHISPGRCCHLAGASTPFRCRPCRPR